MTAADGAGITADRTPNPIGVLFAGFCDPQEEVIPDAAHLGVVAEHGTRAVEGPARVPLTPAERVLAWYGAAK